MPLSFFVKKFYTLDGAMDAPLPKISSAAARYLPFAVFMAFIGLEQLLRFLMQRGLVAGNDNLLLYLYPVKIALVVGILYTFRKQYREVRWQDLQQIPAVLLTVVAGLLVFLLWIGLAGLNSPATGGYNPYQAVPGLQMVLLVLRVLGAAVVVPIMEELFWRSFLIRYIDNHAFEQVPLGQFSWPSFLITVVLFGVEHHLIIAGMVAGIFYNLVLYRTRSLAHCILAHAITNGVLAFYVIKSARWELW